MDSTICGPGGARLRDPEKASLAVPRGEQTKARRAAAGAALGIRKEPPETRKNRVFGG